MSAADDRRLGDLDVRPHEHAVYIHGREVPLTTGEFEILLRLAEHPRWVFSADELSEEFDDGGLSPDSVSVLVCRLRHKLTAAGAGDVVDTVRGAGYRIDPATAKQQAARRDGDAIAQLRDALWLLQERVFDIERDGTTAEVRSVAKMLRDAVASIETSADR